MKKLLFIAVLLVSTLTFGNEVEKESSFIKSSEVINSPDELVACHYTTTLVFYRTITRKVMSMYTNEEVWETVTIIDMICTSCYTITAKGTSVETTCE
ncbi:hypothetical protein [Flavobacterium lacus]|jgi:hypothetical protein|uniref:Uncharacterized protein n=1 Tax=Flavobacterium lacus TaxID=1353778 RepID=A0A328WS61_9FLAO|nr:hypothetical protein [Flavobacterium lacus]RAR48125.1 hypothetical protein B0I10_106127 [Flavobacterium lacus]